VNSRKLIALFLVLALTGSALAAQQQRLYRGSDDGDLEASGVTGVQQHSVFIEIVVERQEENEQIHEFAAVVGLIKECKQVRNVFDNAVLWFNDQFLFGDKVVEDRNVTEDALGANPGENFTENETEGTNPFVGTSDRGTPRWGGCFTPNGFAHAIGADDPFGMVTVNATEDENTTYSSEDAVSDADDSSDDLVFGGDGLVKADDNMDVIKQMIDLDNTCSGCIFEYQSSFFVVDPNDHEWIVDKYVYPLSVMGNFFQSGAGPNCGDDEANETSNPLQSRDASAGDEEASTPSGEANDPRERDSPFANQHHADRCTDENQDSDAENHCYEDTTNRSDEDYEACDGSGDDRGILTDNSTLVEPMFTTHLQTDPTTPSGLGFADTAPYQYDDTGPADANTLDSATVDDVREGAIYPQKDSPTRQACEEDLTYACAIEYNFMLAVDFAAFDDRGPEKEPAAPGAGFHGENEIDRGCAVEHGEGGADNDTEHWQGNSHPHAPNEDNETTQIPQHCHPSVNLDIFFYEDAPYYTEENQYWTESHGTPLSWTADCTTTTETIEDDDPRDPQAIDARTPIVCDADSDAGEYHSDRHGLNHPEPGES